MRIVWISFAFAAFLIGLFAYQGLKWGTMPANAFLISYLGLVGAVVGLFASAIGFTIAVQQVRKTLSASKAAEEALNGVRSKLSALSATGEIERARFALEETERHIHDSGQKNVRYSLSPARQCMVRLHELDFELFKDMKDQIQAAIEEMGDMADVQQAWDKDRIAKNAKLVRSYIDLANRMNVRINRG